MPSEELLSQDRDWWADWFNEHYLDVYPHRNRESARAEAHAAIEWLRLSAENSVLDLCCGSGRHLYWLFEEGITQSVGLDFSVALLKEARKKISPEPYLVRGDMRRLPFSGCFDAVLMFFTSFGYFDTDEENSQVLREIIQVLRPGGGYLIDYLNAWKVKATLEAETVRTQGDSTIHEIRRIVDGGRRVKKEIFIKRNGKEDRYEESLRLYSPPELLAMFEILDCMPDKVYGDFDGSAFRTDSDRVILVRSPRD